MAMHAALAAAATLVRWASAVPPSSAFWIGAVLIGAVLIVIGAVWIGAVSIGAAHPRAPRDARARPKWRGRRLLLFAVASGGLWAGASLGWSPASFRVFYGVGAIVVVPSSPSAPSTSSPGAWPATLPPSPPPSSARGPSAS